MGSRLKVISSAAEGGAKSEGRGWVVVNGLKVSVIRCLDQLRDAVSGKKPLRIILLIKRSILSRPFLLV